MGGYSSEYKISLISGNVVYQFLDKTKYTDSEPYFQEKWSMLREVLEKMQQRSDELLLS
jgi:D-alanine-D-alanine ligase